MEGLDILCQAKSGMGKTAVFALSVLNQLAGDEEGKEPKVSQECSCLVIGHTRELAYQIQKDFRRFGQFSTGVNSIVVFGGVPIEDNIAEMDKLKPQIVVGTPGRLVALMERRRLRL